VVLEALALGCPVIATDCAEGVRTALRGGAYGALTPVGDVEKLAAALESHLVDPRRLRQKAAAGLHSVRTDHSYEVAADRYLDLIRELRDGRPHRLSIAPIPANAIPPT
jgi:glycosyltransferase involved in cell wall biosynthesis